jgi:hypothetical protein
MKRKKIKHMISGKPRLDIELKYPEWLRENDGKISVVQEHPIELSSFSMLVEYLVLRPRKRRN